MKCLLTMLADISMFVKCASTIEFDITFCAPVVYIDVYEY